MTSLRMRLALPVAVVSVSSAALVIVLGLSAIRSRLAEDLQLRLERAVTLLSSLPLTAGEGPELRGMAIVALRPDGTVRVPFKPWEPSDWTMLDPGRSLPRPDEFLEVSAVGLALDARPARWSNVLLPDETAAVLVSTRSTVVAYEELRVRLVLLSVAGALAVILATFVIGGRIGSRIRALSRKISILSSDDSMALDRVHENDELVSLSNELEQARANLVRTQQRIERLQRMRSEFLANVSHEVRTPLFAMKGYLETLLDGGIEDPTVNRTFLEKAQKNAHRLDLLLKDLIEISRIESGDMKLSFRAFQLNALLQAAYETNVEAAHQKGQSLSVEGYECEVIGDRDRLMQALSNLVENAIAYSPNGASIRIRAIADGERATIWVMDDGPGIGPEHHERIFERFYRVDPDRSREAGGTGLGLAIVKHIVEAHGSKVLLESELGRGSTFSFYLKRSA